MARKEKKYHFIYKTTNVLNNKYYYGMHSTDDLNDGYLGSGRRLRYSINKHGEKNHKRKIIEYLPNRKKLISREKEIVNLNEIAKKDCMNLMVGGKGGFVSEEQQKYRSVCGGKALALKLKTDSDFREEHRKRASENLKKQHKLGKFKYDTFTGKKHKQESIEKMKKTHKMNNHGQGENNSQFGTMWICNKELKLNKKINKNDIIPQGWERGRKLK